MSEEQALDAVKIYKEYDCSREDYFSSIRSDLDEHSLHWAKTGRIHLRVLALHLVKRLDEKFLMEDAFEFFQDHGQTKLSISQFQDGGWYEAAKVVEALKTKGDSDFADVAEAHFDLLRKVLIPEGIRRMYLHRRTSEKHYINGLWAKSDDEAYWRLQRIYGDNNFHFAEFGWGTDFKIREIQ